MYDVPATQIAVTRRYEVRANWKLIGGNFRECYHCGIGHPEYCRAISGANLLQSRERFERHRQEKLAQWESRGIPAYRILFEPGSWHYCERYPYEPGVLTQSLDGQAVAPTLGNLTDPDVGVFSIVQYPNFWLDVNNDHVWTMRLTPLGPSLCEAEATWLVRRGVVEGRDYDPERLTGFWRTTAEQDWKLCEDNHSGVESRFYRPGPYATVEDGPNQFVLWYLDQLRRD
jgi:Rieske 2Fe-2S family protein